MTVKYTIYIKAELEGVQELRLKPNVDICVSVRNPLNPEEIREKVVLEASNLVNPEVGNHEKHRNEHPYHLAIKWDVNHNKTKATARIIENTEQAAVLTTSDEYIPIIELECDGLEPYEFIPLGNEFLVVDKTGKQHDDVDLGSSSDDGNNWTTYDISTGSTSVLNFQSKIE